MWDSSSPDPKAEANSENGAVTARTIRLTSARKMMPPTENCGSSNEPEMGSSISISPRLFLSSDTASNTGSFKASGLSTRSPKVSWSRNILLLAWSLPSWIR